MKYCLPVVCAGLVLLAGCDDPEIQELKAANAEQRQQVRQLLETHRATVDELNVQLERQAQQRAEEESVSWNRGLVAGTAVMLGCALAVALAVLLKKRGIDAAQHRA